MHGDIVDYREANRPGGTDLLQWGSTAWPEYPERHHRAAWLSLRRSWFPVNLRDWCGDHGVQREIAEAALGHVVPEVEGDYRRRDALTLRRQLMQKWADFVDQPWQDSANVIRIGAA